MKNYISILGLILFSYILIKIDISKVFEILIDANILFLLIAAFLNFPNQLFKNTEWLSLDHKIFLIEETLFFNHYNFHKQKLIYHRCSMQFY